MNLDTRVGTTWGFREIALYFVDLFINKMKKSLTDITNWADAMQLLANEIHDIHMDKGKILYEGEKYFKASTNTMYKHLYSRGEITKFLNKNSYLGKVRKCLKEIEKLLRILKEVIDFLENLKKIIKGYKTVKQWSNRVAFQRGADSAAPEEILRRQIRIGAERFQVLMEALKTVNSFSPPGFREYADFCLQTCSGASRLFEKVNAYGDRLVTVASETQRGFGSALREKNSWLSLNLEMKYLLKKNRL